MKNRKSPGAVAPNPASAGVCGKYVNLMNDVAFQWVFGREGNKDLLIALLNELIPGLHITDLKYYKQRQTAFAKGLKNGIFDISCRLSDGAFIDVEVQVCPQDWFADRCLYYSTYCIQEQVKAGEEEYLLKPVYVISIDAFARAHAPGWDGSFLSTYSLREDRTGELMTESLHFVFVELKDFDKNWEDIDNDKERFYFCIRHLHELDRLPDGFAKGIWAKLAKQSELAQMPPALQQQYIKKMTTEIDKRAQLKYAQRIGREQGYAEGHAEGLEKGHAEGLAKGHAEGHAEGMKQGMKHGLQQGLEQGLEQGRIQTARNLKSAGIPLDVICQCTGLSPEQVEQF